MWLEIFFLFFFCHKTIVSNYVFEFFFSNIKPYDFKFKFKIVVTNYDFNHLKKELNYSYQLQFCNVVDTHMHKTLVWKGV